MNAIGKAAAIVAIYIAVGPTVIAFTIGVIFAGIAAIGEAVESNGWLQALTSFVVVAPMLGASLAAGFRSGRAYRCRSRAGCGFVVGLVWTDLLADERSCVLPGYLPARTLAKPLQLGRLIAMGNWPSADFDYPPRAGVHLRLGRKTYAGPSEASASKPPPEMKL